MATSTLPTRSEVHVKDTWDLSALFVDDAAWEAAFASWRQQVDRYTAFQGRLGESAAVLRELLEFDTAMDRQGERLGNYAFLRVTEDKGNGHYQGMKGRYLNAASTVAEKSSYMRPEILALPEATLAGYLADPSLADFKLMLERLIRYKPHTLSPAEERLLAMQTESAQTASTVFGQLNDADLKFGTLKDGEGGEITLTHATYMTCLYAPNRDLRQRAFHQYYAEYKDHQNTLAATLVGSIQRDIYEARARNYGSAREAALFPDNMPPAVYDNLIATVHRFLPALHRFYDIRKRAMQLPDIHQYDVYVPILSDLEKNTPWDEAVELTLTALAPLGSDYVNTLAGGLRGRWCDKYENRGKQSGAFSCGCYDGDPYILMNYQPKVLNHVFTLAHEAGHSMHSYYSCKNQPFQYHHYAIFVAEVASTFNEELLSEHLLKHASAERERAYYINREIDDIRTTIFRQTMFAEFEMITHQLAESGAALTLDVLKAEYRKLLDLYFGPNFTIDPELEMECLRIPHFYRAFYVYKYATGLAAAIALSQKVLQGGAGERDAYLRFLASGSSKEPLDLLRDAGVDMSSPKPVEIALQRFTALVDEFDRLV